MLTVWGGATSRTLRAYWMLHELGLDYEAKLIGPRTEETASKAFRALNPKGKVPVLVDGDLVLTESAAIVTYLGDTYGPDSGLVPRPYTPERARYNEWSSFIQMELDAHTLYVVRKHRDLAALYGEAPAAVATAIEGFNRQVVVAEQTLAKQPFLLGEQFTGADLLLSTCVQWAVLYDIPVSDTLAGFAERTRERPAFRQAAKLNFSISPGA